MPAKIQDSLGNLQYVPFPVCNETGLPLAFTYDTSAQVRCTVEYLEDDLYHLLEYFVHNDVPLTCRVPAYPLQSGLVAVTGTSAQEDAGTSSSAWTPLTIALQGTLENSHLHIHTSINTLFHTAADLSSATSRLIAATAYSLPELTPSNIPVKEGSKVVRLEPLTFAFNTGWVEGVTLPGMLNSPRSMTSGRVKDHGLGFTLLCACALAASAGLGAMIMMIWERKRNRGWLGRLDRMGMNASSGNAGFGSGDLGGGSNGNGAMSSSSSSSVGFREMGFSPGPGLQRSHSGYGGYGRYSAATATGKRD